MKPKLISSSARKTHLCGFSNERIPKLLTNSIIPENANSSKPVIHETLRNLTDY